MSDAQTYPGWLDLHQMSDETSAIKFLIAQTMAKASHVAVVLVKAVHGGGIANPPTVDVQPMVNQIDQDGKAQAHGTISGLPCLRIQGGANAIVIDPQVGDIGMCVFADRDISSAVANQAPANPGSWRRFDWADGVYLGSIGQVTPTAYVQIDGSGNINMTSLATVTIKGSGIVLDGPVTGNSTATFSGEVQGNAIKLSAHRHTGVQTGGGDTGEPITP